MQKCKPVKLEVYQTQQLSRKTVTFFTHITDITNDHAYFNA